MGGGSGAADGDGGVAEAARLRSAWRACWVLALARLALGAAPAARYQGRSVVIGMSDDFETAVMIGATHVRIGSALFGDRPPVRTPTGFRKPK